MTPPLRPDARLADAPPPSVAGVPPLAQGAVEVHAPAASAHVAAPRPRTRRLGPRIAALVLGGLLFGSIPRSTPATWRPDTGYTPPSVSIGRDAGERATRRSFGVPFRVVTLARTPTGAVDTVVVQPLALLGDAVVGGFVLAVLVQWWRRRRAAGR